MIWSGTADGEVIVLGGEDHKTGQVVETVDGLSYIGPIKKRQFVATGFAGNGMTFGTVAAIMARDYIAGRNNGWEETFAPDRVALAAVVCRVPASGLRRGME
jgi:glycine/D-amino acid oxidase-like deaminating enzyme